MSFVGVGVGRPLILFDVWLMFSCLGTFDLCCFQGRLIRKGAKICKVGVTCFDINLSTVLSCRYLLIWEAPFEDPEEGHSLSHLLLLCPNASVWAFWALGTVRKRVENRMSTFHHVGRQ